MTTPSPPPARWRQLAATVRHLQPGQLVARVIERARRIADERRGPRPWGSLAHRAPALSPAHAPVTATAAIAAWRTQLQPRDVVWGDVFTFLSVPLDFTAGIDWDMATPAAQAVVDRALWRFHLHYMDWLWAVEPPYRQRAIADWCARCPLGAPGGFGGQASPYTIARRLPNWLLALPAGSPAWESARGQLAFLAGRLEWEHRANHLLENLIALVTAAWWMEDAAAARWLDRYQTLLRSQLDEQFLHGGVHFERSTAYHVELLGRLGDLWLLQQARPLMNARLEKRLGDVLARGVRFVRHLMRPDGTLPLLGDSNAAMRPRPAELLARAGMPPVNEAPARVLSGHVVLADARRWVLFDAAPLGPDFSGAHQHADLMAVEIWIDGRAVVVDGGTGVYTAGPERAADRAAGAHAVPMVDGVACAEPWASFRMGRRGHPHRLEVNEGGAVAETHDAFAPAGCRHWRSVRLARTDVVEIHDLFEPTARRRMVDFHWPLAPGLVPTAWGPGQWRLLDEEGHTVATVEVVGGRVEDWRAATGRVWLDFGRAVARNVLAIRCLLSDDAGVTTLFTAGAPNHMPAPGE